MTLHSNNIFFIIIENFVWPIVRRQFCGVLKKISLSFNLEKWSLYNVIIRRSHIS